MPQRRAVLFDILYSRWLSKCGINALTINNSRSCQCRSTQLTPALCPAWLCDFLPGLSGAQSLSTLCCMAIKHGGFTGLCHSERVKKTLLNREDWRWWKVYQPFSLSFISLVMGLCTGTGALRPDDNWITGNIISNKFSFFHCASVLFHLVTLHLFIFSFYCFSSPVNPTLQNVLSEEHTLHYSTSLCFLYLWILPWLGHWQDICWLYVHMHM